MEQKPIELYDTVVYQGQKVEVVDWGDNEYRIYSHHPETGKPVWEWVSEDALMSLVHVAETENGIAVTSPLSSAVIIVIDDKLTVESLVIRSGEELETFEAQLAQAKCLLSWGFC